MKRFTRRAAPLLPGILIGFSSLVHTSASDRIALDGDILQYLLPATAAGLTLGYKDGDGGLEFGASAALTLGVNHGLTAAGIPSLRAMVRFHSRSADLSDAASVEDASKGG